MFVSEARLKATRKKIALKHIVDFEEELPIDDDDDEELTCQGSLKQILPTPYYVKESLGPSKIFSTLQYLPILL